MSSSQQRFQNFLYALEMAIRDWFDKNQLNATQKLVIQIVIGVFVALVVWKAFEVSIANFKEEMSRQGSLGSYVDLSVGTDEITTPAYTLLNSRWDSELFGLSSEGK